MCRAYTHAHTRAHTQKRAYTYTYSFQHANVPDPETHTFVVSSGLGTLNFHAGKNLYRAFLESVKRRKHGEEAR